MINCRRLSTYVPSFCCSCYQLVFHQRNKKWNTLWLIPRHGKNLFSIAFVLLVKWLETSDKMKSSFPPWPLTCTVVIFAISAISSLKESFIWLWLSGLSVDHHLDWKMEILLYFLLTGWPFLVSLKVSGYNIMFIYLKYFDNLIFRFKMEHQKGFLSLKSCQQGNDL